MNLLEAIDTLKAGPTDPQMQLDLYMYLERYVNDGSPSGFQLNIAPEFSPTSGRSFSLPLVPLESTLLTQIGDLPPQWTFEGTGSQILFPVHPVTFGEVRPQLPATSEPSYTQVRPTSSGRTVFVQLETLESYYIKLHYPKRLGRFQRDLRLYQWIASLEKSAELFANQGDFPSPCAFLHEFGGLFLEHTGAEGGRGFGAIFRDFLPLPRRGGSGSRILVPAFSLFARRYASRDVQPVLSILLGQDQDSLSIFLDRFIIPLVNGYVYLATQIGMIPECNAQNVLYEVDFSDDSTRVVFRDMGDVFTDMQIRRGKGLHTSFCSYKSLDPQRDADLYMRRSFAYDFKLGEYLLRPLASCFASIANMDVAKVLEAVRDYARTQWADYPDYFANADTWYAYPNQATVDRSSYVELRTPAFR